MLTRWPVVTHQHEDISDHRFEQRGLLHVQVLAARATGACGGGAFGLIRASRARQVAQLQRYIEREVPAAEPLLVAGDFNDWGSLVRNALYAANLRTFEASQQPTFPARRRRCNWTTCMAEAWCRWALRFPVDAAGGACRTICH